MITVYYKQAWQLLRQNKLYSAVYIIGTGLAIAMTMVLAMVYYIKIAPVYPEQNRDRILVASSLRLNYLEMDGMISAGFSHNFVKEHFYTMQSPQAVSAVKETWEDFPLVDIEHQGKYLSAVVKYVDHNFWKVFSFDFLSGKPFTQADLQSAIHTAVISASMANTLFGTVEAEGHYMTMDGNNYRIAGVVRDASVAAPDSYAQVWIPYSVSEEAFANAEWMQGILGAMKVYMLAPSRAGVKAVQEEADDMVRKFNNGREDYNITLSGQPEIFWKSVFRVEDNVEIDWAEIIKTFGTMLLALLIVPAVNLAGMVTSRMEKRLPEIGIRKAFGASDHTLIRQILTENFLFTFLGGLLGLVLSGIFICTGKDWVLLLFDKNPVIVPEGINTSLSVAMVFNPTVFLVTFALCFILNFLSAFIPARYGLRKGIVYALNGSR